MDRNKTTQPTADTYGLTRNADESLRLNNQHAVWKKNIGFLLHPCVAASIPSDARIGDVGTGTGVWLTDLASEPNDHGSSYQGFDISASQFPSSPPKTVSFSVLNILDPIPEHMIGTLDVVHLRLLVLGLPKNTWELACKNLLQMLKPGGWLQWEEADFASMQVLQSEVGATTHAAERLRDLVIEEGSRRGQGFQDVPKLRSLVANAGFRDVHEDVFSSDRDSGLREAFSKTVTGAMSGIIEMFGKMEGGEQYWATDAARKMHQDAVAELADGKAYFRADITIICGQKAP